MLTRPTLPIASNPSATLRKKRAKQGRNSNSKVRKRKGKKMKAVGFFRGFFGRPGSSLKSKPGIPFMAALLFGAVLISIPSRGDAQAGKLDSTFGAAGVVSLSSGALGTTTKIQSDGKILIGGQIKSEAAVGRLLSNGTLDSTFGNNGIVSITFPEIFLMAPKL
jgi:Domain of unknown function (DUF5122) beta-propeller